MKPPAKFRQPIPNDYCGVILHGDYSDALKTRVADFINRFRMFEETGIPGILYIAAWQENRKKIWYEFASRSFIELMNCNPIDLPAVFRDSIIARSTYQYISSTGRVKKEVTPQDQILHFWRDLRTEGVHSGEIEAVYKVSLPLGCLISLKDSAKIGIHPKDGICLSTGFMTTVSKEMETEDELERYGDRLEEELQQRTSDLVLLNKKLRQEIDERKLIEKKLQQSYYRLECNLDGIVWAMSMAVEERDQYTAGHQRRTTALAVAIAKEMKFSKDKIKGLQLAGLIHDIGKISIPAEILSKPGKLNEIEHQLIKRHPQVAFEILKKIDFQWPVDLIVFQHHERINGKGYPQGLSSEEVLLEARILSVADVVESMASHRPYRPAMGIEKAIEEITINRGLLYDSNVVDAFLKVIERGECRGIFQLH